MRNLVVLLTLSTATLALSACGGNRGFAGGGPDEMAVSRKVPLIVPPDFALVPPAPGTPNAGSAATDVNHQALDAMFGGPSPRSSAETSTVNLAGGSSAELGIRSSVGDLPTSVVDKGGLTRDIIASPEGDGKDARAVVPPKTAAPGKPG